MSNRGKKGQTLLEVVTAVVLVTLVLTALVGLAVAAVRSATVSRNRVVATSYAQEGLEALRSIRDRSFSELYACRGGMSVLIPGPPWSCQANSPTPEVLGIFQRSFILTQPAEAGKLKVAMHVIWTDNAGIHDVLIPSWLTDWR